MHDHKRTANNHFQTSVEFLGCEDSDHTLHWAQNRIVNGRVYSYSLF